MTDIVITLSLAGIATIIAIKWMRRRDRKLRERESLRTSAHVLDHGVKAVGDRYGRPSYAGGYNPGISVVETNSGFSEGLLMGAAMQADKPVYVEQVLKKNNIKEKV